MRSRATALWRSATTYSTAKCHGPRAVGKKRPQLHRPPRTLPDPGPCLARKWRLRMEELKSARLIAAFRGDYEPRRIVAILARVVMTKRRTRTTNQRLPGWG